MYRHRKLDAQFIPNGGTVNDGAVRTDYWLSKSVRLSGWLQYEKWQIPALDSSVRSNVTASLKSGFGLVTGAYVPISMLRFGIKEVNQQRAA